MNMAARSVPTPILSSVLASESCIVLEEDGESLIEQDASNNITSDSKSLSEPSCDETALDIPDHCIVDNTPPQNRKKLKIGGGPIGVWRDVKRLKGLGAERADLAQYTHVCRVILPCGDPCNHLLKLYRGKLHGKGVGTGSWINTKAERHIVNSHAEHVRAVKKVERENDAHEAKVALMLQQPTL